MAEIPVETFCPYGAECESIKNGKIMRCQMYIHLRGTNDMTGELIDRMGCAIEWTPLLLIQNTNKVAQVAAATESFRNKVVEGNEQMAAIMMNNKPAVTDERVVGNGQTLTGVGYLPTLQKPE